MLSRPAPSRFESLPASPFYIGLVLSGLATVLLGPILPVISARWLLTDAQAGSLFTSQFTASIVGAVLSSYYRRRCVVLGYASIALGLATLSLGNYAAALAGLWFMGLGIGAAVTATNLIFGTEYPERRGKLLTWTNFFWGVGAVTAPQLVAIAERHGALRFFLITAAAATFLISAVFAPLLKRSERERNPPTGADSGRMGMRIFLLFSLTLFLYVGGETAIAGWIATYAHRFENLSVARSSMVVGAFWLSIVIGRATVPVLLRFFSELAVLLSGVFAAMAGLLLLLTPRSVTITLVAVAMTGCGCAPIFPLSVSRLLARVGRSRSTGWIFAICGSGGAVIPWLTGLLSEHSGSLRTAFAVPLSAMAAILLCTLLENALPISGQISIPDSSKQFY
jgi:FHS family glucose/mannose:H+ symporter-like MFS transporter